MTGAAGIRCRAAASTTASASVRRPGRNPLRASATVRVVKNSRPQGRGVSGFVAGLLPGSPLAAAMTLRSVAVRLLARLGACRGCSARQPEHAHHRAQRDLPEAADRGHAQGLLQLEDAVADVSGAAAASEHVAEYLVGF